MVVSAGLTLGLVRRASEDGFSAYVADHWPHWAGGMPGDVPPRPGAPGYDEFIAHGQADQDAAAAAGWPGALRSRRRPRGSRRQAGPPGPHTQQPC